LTKLSNFIPEAGIWMNTLRPEWNDANNALVGNGDSMVTLYYMHRFVVFMKNFFESETTSSYQLSEEVYLFFSLVNTILNRYEDVTHTGFNDIQRRLFADETGKAGSTYRKLIYERKSISKKKLHQKELLSFLDLTLQYIDQSVSVNKRKDNMYHAYNLIHFRSDSVSIHYLNEMLEGQVAVLSSGVLNPDEVLQLLDAMKKSDLYRTDQESYMLYPDKKLPLFIEKNRIEMVDIESIKTLKILLEKGDANIIQKDSQGGCHFHADFKNVGHLEHVLNKLKTARQDEISDEDFQQMKDLYEKTFKHQYFTGRSGTFYKYEGLGSIYWHMVSKLLLTIGENISQFAGKQTKETTINRIVAHYHHGKKGIGAGKSPAAYGSFPVDPYSHTPSMSGVQQPGMTGQVKEDIISRFIELGVFVTNGQINFNPLFLNKSEFILKSDDNAYAHPFLKFTYCNIPVIYLADGNAGVELVDVNNQITKVNNYTLTLEQSRSVFYRESTIKQVIVHLPNLGDGHYSSLWQI
jgi:hypothetical protein